MDEPFIATEKPKKRRSRKILDVVIAVAIILVIGFLVKALVGQISLKNEVASARTVTDKVITDIRNKNGKGVRSVGSKTFQSQNSEVNLTGQFESISKFTGSAPVVNHQTVTNENGQQSVSIIYRFPKKPEIYVRVIVVKPKGGDKFQLVNLEGNITEKPLLDNKY